MFLVGGSFLKEAGNEAVKLFEKIKQLHILTTYTCIHIPTELTTNNVLVQ